MKMRAGLCLVAAAAHAIVGVGAAPERRGHQTGDAASDFDTRGAPTVTVNAPAGSIKGAVLLNVEGFRGIPFAEPPLGQLRLRRPQRLTKRLDNFDATGGAPACPQLIVSTEARDIISKFLDPLLQTALLKPLTGKEDCLTITVQRPEGTRAGDNLPVLFWIHPGGYDFGSSSILEPADLVNAAVMQGQPFVFVAINYRLAGFGFLPGAEVKAAGVANLGLLDQRMGLEWVQDNIAAFGGDPSKVTIWGESAGAWSVVNHLVMYGGDATYKGKDLFRGAIMNSGSLLPALPVDAPKAQQIYDQVVDRAGCSGQNDTLACLREADYDTFLDAVNSLPGLIALNSLVFWAYIPRPDGDVLPGSQEELISSGRYHAVPMISGMQEDEGTLFTLPQTNLKSTEDIVNSFAYAFRDALTKDEVRAWVDTYDPSPAAGSPFRTGMLNNLYPSFKRFAAIAGDIFFSLSRRALLDLASIARPDVPSWSYLASYDYGTPVLGTTHASDMLQVFLGIWPNNAARSCRTYYYNFIHNLDPNVGNQSYANWPRWREGKQLMWFKTAFRNSYLKDDFRAKSYQWIWDNLSKMRQ